MGRRNRQSPAEGFLSDVFELCTLGPIWVGPLIAAIVFSIFYFLIPWYLSDPVSTDLSAQVSKLPNSVFRNVSKGMAPLLSLIILVVWAVAEFKKFARRRSDAADDQPKPPAAQQHRASANAQQSPACPLCGAAMKIQIAKRGPHPGSQFWGCSQFGTKNCRGKRPVA